LVTLMKPLAILLTHTGCHSTVRPGAAEAAPSVFLPECATFDESRADQAL